MYSERSSPTNRAYNEFFVHYDKDPATGDYKKVRFVKNPSAGSYSSEHVSTMTSGSSIYGGGEEYWNYCVVGYEKIGTVQPKHIYLDRVSDDITAENVLALAILWLYERKPEITFSTQLQICDLELCDVIGVTDGAEVGTYFIFGVAENLDNKTMTLKAREVSAVALHWEDGDYADDIDEIGM